MLELFLSTFRRNEQDVVNLYNTFSRLMQITSGGDMLNFGYWDIDTQNPLQAQYTLSNMVGEFASLKTARTLIDAGSGYSAPAIQWKSQYNSLEIICININLEQLKAAAVGAASKFSNKKMGKAIVSDKVDNSSIHNFLHLNATSTMLPVKSKSIDRVIAFESAQHFKPLIQFVQESNRVLRQEGLLVMAVPVIADGSFLSLPLFAKLGILSVTWASEHYRLKFVISMVKAHGFEIKDIKYIGSNVYEPLARYYIDNREKLKNIIFTEYPKFLETILYRSILKMKAASNRGIIEYILLKAEKT
jgi:SAM-dependent methyltransferase